MSHKLTTQKFITKAKLIHGNKYNYDFVNYKTAKDKVIIICPFHGEFKQRPSSHTQGQGCILCRNDLYSKTFKRTIEEWINKAKFIHNNKYNYSKTIRKKNNKVIIICPFHGEFEQDMGSHIRGHGCNKCAKDLQCGTTDSFIKKAKVVHGNIFDYSKVEYINSIIKVNIICNKCLKIFKQIPANHLQGQGCPKCKESKGEKRIQKYLLEQQISFKTQYRFPDCKGKRYSLPFDVCIFNNDDILFLIEYDGEQHFNSKQFGQKALQSIQIRDEIKNQYCKNNNISLLRIPYTKFNKIEFIISNYIKEIRK